MKWEEVTDKSLVYLAGTVNEGKTKRIETLIYEDVTTDAVITDAVAMVFKNDITAGDGVKHDVLEGKALIDWRTNKNIYEYLNSKGINTHYIGGYPSEEGISIVKKLDRKINLEVVSRRIATGSILKHTNIIEGTVFKPLYTQFFYKDDFLHDPLLEWDFIKHITENKNCRLFRDMEVENSVIFQTLEAAFAKFKIQLIDMKLEYGIVDGKICLIDEITGGSFRLWPYAGETVDLACGAALYQLNPKGRLDKDLYRRGEVSLDAVYNKFKEIAEITDQFKNLNL